MMNRLIIVLTCLWAMPGVCAGTASPDEKDFLYAQMHGAEVMFVLKVVDDRAEAVPGADVWAGMPLYFSDGGGRALMLKTDRQGECVVRGRTTDLIPLFISKDGYYSTELSYNFSVTESRPRVEKGRWMPFGDVRRVVLKKMRCPVLLNQPRPRGLPHVWRRIPAWGQWLDMDCEAFDWLPPYGKGQYGDMQVRFSKIERRRHLDFRYEMNVSFTNNPLAGVYVVGKDLTSDLHGPYHAETNGSAYASTYTYILDHLDSGKKHATETENSCFVFRTRTRVDECGHLLSAHYGYIMGPWGMGRDRLVIGTSRFNPVPNDTNLEDEEGARRAWSNLRIFREHQGKK